MGAKFVRRVAFAVMLASPIATSAATYTLTLEEAVLLARRRSPEARRIDLEERRSLLLHRGARRELWPDLNLDLTAPEYAQHFDVAPLPSAPGDTAFTGEPSRIVYAKTTTTSRNASGNLRYQQLLPWRGTLSAGSSVMYHDEETSPEGARAPRNDYQVSASVGIDVPILGDQPNRRALERADLEWRHAREQTRAALAALEFDTVSRYLDLVRARMTLDLARAEAKQAATAQEQATRKVASGLIADVDRMRTDLFRAEREARLASAEAQVARARDQFKLLLGLDVRDSLILTEDQEPAPIESLSTEAWVERALANRADIGLQAQELELLERDRRARVAHRPDIGLSLRYGGGASEAALDEAIRALSANDLSLRLGLRMPLWDSGRLSLEDGAQAVQLEERRLEFERNRATIEVEVRDALRGIDAARRRYEALAASNRLAMEVRRITGERYERGLVDTQTLLAAQNDVAAAQLDAASSLLDLHRAQARLWLVTLSREE